jgi:hypothetical protein
MKRYVNPLLVNGWKYIWMKKICKSSSSQWMKNHIQISCPDDACIKKKIKRKGERLCLVNTEWTDEWKARELMDGKLWCLFSFGPTFLGFLRKVKFWVFFSLLFMRTLSAILRMVFWILITFDFVIFLWIK